MSDKPKFEPVIVDHIDLIHSKSVSEEVTRRGREIMSEMLKIYKESGSVIIVNGKEWKI